MPLIGQIILSAAYSIAIFAFQHSQQSLSSQLTRIKHSFFSVGIHFIVLRSPVENSERRKKFYWQFTPGSLPGSLVMQWHMYAHGDKTQIFCFLWTITE